MPPKPKTPTTDQKLRALGLKIQKARKAKGWSLCEFSRQVPYAKSGLRLIERGKRAPSVTTLGHIAEALELPFTYFVQP